MSCFELVLRLRFDHKPRPDVFQLQRFGVHLLGVTLSAAGRRNLHFNHHATMNSIHLSTCHCRAARAACTQGGDMHALVACHDAELFDLAIRIFLDFLFGSHIFVTVASKQCSRNVRKE